MMLSPLTPHVPPEVTLPKKTATELQKLRTQHEALEPLTVDSSSGRFEQEIELRRAAYHCCGEVEKAFMVAIQAASDERARQLKEFDEHFSDLPVGLKNAEINRDHLYRLALDHERRVRGSHQSMIEWRRARDTELWQLEQRQKGAKKRERFHAGVESRPPVSKSSKTGPLFGPETRDDPMGRAGKLIEQRGGTVAAD